jgi:glycosyltransferase involved in cell wall biosynthesis
MISAGNTPMKVSVLITTYNHEQFIAQAIESVLMQKVDFDYEIVIGEDCSTDGTRDIVIDFHRRDPDRIRLSLTERNLGGAGNMNFFRAFQTCRGQYIAMLEGDDYWTSPQKLQKQVEFLDDHPECAICFHNVDVHKEDSHENHLYFRGELKPVYTFNDLVRGPFFPTGSIVFRAGLISELPEWFYTTVPGDWPLFLLIAQHGDIGYIDEVLGVRRQHRGGVWHSKGTINQLKGLTCAAETIKHHFSSKSRTKFNETIGQYHYRIARLLWEENDYLMASVHAMKCLISSPFISISIFKEFFAAILRERFPRMYHFLRQYKTKETGSPRLRGGSN